MGRARISLWLAGISLISLLLVSMGLSQDTLSQSALSRLSDKDLYKRANAENNAGRLDSAREAIFLVIQRAIDRNKKPNKKYQELFDSLNARLADREAAAGENACKLSDFADCRKRIASAKNFVTTPRIRQLEASFNDAIDKLGREYQSAVAQAARDPESALQRLATLLKYEEFLPDVKKEHAGARSLFLQRLVDEGRSAIGEKRWDDAILRFERVLATAPDHGDAKAGIETVGRARNAYMLLSQGVERAKAKRFEEAMDTIQGALSFYPEAKSEFDQAQRQTSQSWVSTLMADIPALIGDQDNLEKSRDAYVRLQKILELDPGQSEALAFLSEAQQNFATNATPYAQKLAEIKDLSRIATATILKYEIQRLIPDLMPPEELKGAMVNFNRKRICQLVLSVEDLAAATTDFTQSIQARTRSIIEKQSLRDLRLRSREDYERSPNDDLQFQYFLPDGKSYTAMLTVNVTKYQFRKSPKVSDVKSQYILGTEKYPNPEYEKLSRQRDTMREALNSPSRKKGKPTREGWTEADLELLTRELDRTEKLLDRDKRIDYSYQTIAYKQNTDVEVEMVLRDYFSKEVIAQDKIRYSAEQEGTEVSGVRDTDVSGVHTQPLRLPEKEESLAEGARIVREDLDKKLPQLLHSYTTRFFGEGEKSLKAGRSDDAVEAYLCHWAFFGGHLDQSQMDKIVDIVKRATGFDLLQHGDKLMAQLLTVPVVQ